MHTLEFEANERGRKRYELCTQAFILTTKQPQLAEYDDIIAVMRKLKSIGTPADTMIANQAVQLYDLADDGGVIELERSELKVLIDYVKVPIWRPIALEGVRDCRVWLENMLPERRRALEDGVLGG